MKKTFYDSEEKVKMGENGKQTSKKEACFALESFQKTSESEILLHFHHFHQFHPPKAYSPEAVFWSAGEFAER